MYQRKPCGHHPQQNKQSMAILSNKEDCHPERSEGPAFALVFALRRFVSGHGLSRAANPPQKTQSSRTRRQPRQLVEKAQLGRRCAKGHNFQLCHIPPQKTESSCTRRQPCSNLGPLGRKTNLNFFKGSTNKFERTGPRILDLAGPRIAIPGLSPSFAA
jgi:hypothetical protein